MSGVHRILVADITKNGTKGPALKKAIEVMNDPKAIQAVIPKKEVKKSK